ncbi:hypothetical protein BIW11_10401 [Tropilaelaps mercedesae]|uniref:Uncharacterized protein n=1 Tax=Tropilaelaps mercedesae TaxID=418985 RepID=A0A1V9XG64_9ACAR|nr:hypothetical protein BIW11_10401 [Tropilaelaps mercedesae]
MVAFEWFAREDEDVRDAAVEKRLCVPLNEVTANKGFPPWPPSARYGTLCKITGLPMLKISRYTTLKVH